MVQMLRHRIPQTCEPEGRIGEEICGESNIDRYAVRALQMRGKQRQRIRYDRIPLDMNINGGPELLG